MVRSFSICVILGPLTPSENLGEVRGLSPLSAPHFWQQEENLEGNEQALFMDFIRSMLKWLPEDRPTAKQAMQHEWLRTWSVCIQTLEINPLKYSRHRPNDGPRNSWGFSWARFIASVSSQGFLRPSVFLFYELPFLHQTTPIEVVGAQIFSPMRSRP